MNSSDFRHNLISIATSKWFIFALFFAAGVLAPMLKYSVGNHNNIKIFFSAPLHLANQTDLYQEYPHEHFDYFLYGPIFCLFSWPFSQFPEALGVILFLATTTAIFLAGVYLLNLNDREKAIFCMVCFFDFLTNQQNFQTNGMVAAFILLAVAMVQRNREATAAFFVAFGFLFKLYGIVGLVLFLFARRRLRFSLAFAGWSIVLFLLPALFSSLEFNAQMYRSWFERLGAENSMNLGIKEGHGYKSIFDFFIRGLGIEPAQKIIIAVAAAISIAPLFIGRRCWNPESGMLALTISLVLLSIVIFSTGSENPTFVILQTGAAVWFLYQLRKGRLRIGLIAITLIVLFSSLVPTDLYYGEFGEWYDQKALRILPGALLWIAVTVEMWLVSCRPPGLDSDSDFANSEPRNQNT